MCFAAIPYTTLAFNGNSPKNMQSTAFDITSNLEVGQKVPKIMFGCHLGQRSQGRIFYLTLAVEVFYCMVCIENIINTPATTFK